MPLYDRPRFTVGNYYKWLIGNWQYVGVALGIYLAVYLTVTILPKNKLEYAMLMVFPLYILHEFEEYLVPGGFPEFFNRTVFKVDRNDDLVPLDREAIFWINIGYVWIPIPIFCLLSLYDIRFGIWIPYFLIFQAIVHVFLGINGKRLLNPGMVTAWLVHVPFAIWILAMIHAEGYLPNYLINVYIIIGFLVNLTLPVIGFGPVMHRYNRRVQETLLTHKAE